MKQFFKMLLASFTGCIVAAGLMLAFTFSLIGSLAALTEDTGAVLPSSFILRIDLSQGIAEQTVEESLDLQAFYNGGESITSYLGILDAVKAINYAASDPAVKMIYINNCSFTADVSYLEELRSALLRFRNSGKPIIAYGDNLSLEGWYIASAADKIYLSELATNQIYGISSRVFYLKDILDRLGVNVQLIRHGKYKSAGEMFIADGMSPANREQNQAMVSSIWNTLCADISASRGYAPGEIDAITDGLKATTAAEMVECRMIDGIRDRTGMTEDLCTMFGAEDEKGLRFADLSRYASDRLTEDYRAKDKIAIIYADGEILAEEKEEQITADRFVSIISKVRADSTVKAVVFRVNSPGGDAQTAETIRHEMELLSEVKPVVASYGPYAASGGYWISAGAHKIFTDRTSLTGSIGVFSMIPDFSRAFREKLHVNPVTVGSGPHADIYSLMRPLDEQEIESMQKSVEQIYDKFLSIVSQGRGMTVEAVDEIAQGRVWTGAEALETGLADECGGISDALNYAASAAGLDTYRLISYPVMKTTLEKIVSVLYGTEESVRSLMNISDPEEYMHTLYEKAVSHTGVQARIPYYYEFR